MVASTSSSSPPQAAGAPAAPARRQRRGSRETAERILDAAEALFADRGYAATTLRDVASAVGIRNPSLYNHFTSKAALYEAVLARGIGPVLSVLEESGGDGIAGGRDSGRVVERVIEVLSVHPNLARLVLHETLSGGQHLTPILRDWIGPAFARAYEMIESGPAARRWKPEHIPLLVLAMYHIVVGYFAIAPLYKDISGQDLTTEEARRRHTEFVGRVVEALFSEE